MIPTSRRQRGVILTSTGWQKLHNARVTQEQFGFRQTFEVLSERTLLAPATIAKIVNSSERVDKRSIQQLFNALELQLEAEDYTQSTLAVPTNNHQQQDWQEAVEVTSFYGRSCELNTLAEWVIKQRCRLVTLLGQGGIGKTTLSVKSAQQLAPEFEFVIWKSLRNPPPLAELLTDLVQFLSNQQAVMLPNHGNQGISHLLKYLRDRRCLIVLDNANSLLVENSCTNGYREGCEDYEQLWAQVAQTPHQSCLVLTACEPFPQLRQLERVNPHICSLSLGGLELVASQALCQEQGPLFGSEADWQVLVEHYAGNPLALKIVAAAIRDYFQGDIAEFIGYLQQGRLLFDDIRDLFEQQFERLSGLEQRIMYWLAINQEGVTFAQLRAELLPAVPPGELLEGLNLLRQRCLIEQKDSELTLQPVMMEYVTERLVKQVCQEIKTQQLFLFQSHALMKAQALDQVREAQVRLILQPIIEGLLSIFGGKERLEERLTQIRTLLQELAPQEPGYAGGNVHALLAQLGTACCCIDCSHSTMWRADLRHLDLEQVYVSSADLTRKDRCNV
ncbi:MAG: hypothetical protein JO235_19275 [Chroococcidiopsidaceae cyanobacterium CP_BM_RX_35]|nr:hypothetical protein [Chroococcidiopsidaceae cyanobacterium CP_BM_RX_35]